MCAEMPSEIKESECQSDDEAPEDRRLRVPRQKLHGHGNEECQRIQRDQPCFIRRGPMMEFDRMVQPVQNPSLDYSREQYERQRGPVRRGSFRIFHESSVFFQLLKVI